MDQQGNESIYQERMDKFQKFIRLWQRDEQRKVAQKSKDQVEYESHKILSEAHERDDETYAKKVKGIEVEAKIKRSRKINEMRLSKMKLRFEVIEKIQDQIKEKLMTVRQDHTKYSRLLEDLIMQGMVRMLEEKVEVKCVSKDIEAVKIAMKKAQLLFSNICEVKTELILCDERLPDSELGGIVLTSLRGKIVCNNTLRARLDYALQLSLPEVRATLFTNQG